MFRLQRHLIIFRYFFLNYFRSRGFYFMLFFVLFISGIMAYASFAYVNDLGNFISVSSGIPGDLKERFLEYFWGMFVPYIALFASAFFGAGAIAGEIEDGTANFTFSLPMNRHSLLVGKFAAAYVSSIFISGIYYIAQSAVYTAIFHTLPSYPILLSFLIAMLFTVSILSIVFLLSSLFRRTLYASLSVVILYFIVFQAMTLISEIFYNTVPQYLINNASGAIFNVYVGITFSATGIIGTLQPAGASFIIYSSLVMACYAIACIVASILIFERRESL